MDVPSFGGQFTIELKYIDKSIIFPILIFIRGEKMSAPEEICGLIERFDRNLDTYRSGRYNEAQVRQEFINPFFNALGWDVYNKHGYAEAYKDVIHEDAIRVDSAVKAPDYCFRIGGTRKFFLEAKKPSVNIREEINPAYQL
jgi:hypothetical protein